MALVNHVAAHYDDLDQFYRDIWGHHIHHGLWLSGKETPKEATEQLIHLLMARGRMEPGVRILDAGSGYGGTARFLADQLKANVTAVTLSTRQHVFATEQPTPRWGSVEYQLGDFFRMDVSPSYDYVMAVESLSHMDEPALFFKRASSFLRPGGRVIVCAWLAAEHPAEWKRKCLLDPISREGHLSGLPSASRVASWIADAGLLPVSFDDLSNHVRHTWSVCLKRLAGRLLTNPQYRRFLIDRSETNRTFALTLLRIWLAYRVGAMRYGVFVCEKARMDTGMKE